MNTAIKISSLGIVGALLYGSQGALSAGVAHAADH